MSQIYKACDEIGFGKNLLIENAGRGLAKLAIKFLAKKPNARVVVLVGTAYNGGIGICAARHLANHGVHTIICRSRAYGLAEEVTYQR
jgi:NAD(P)H-hydrate epimerase